MFAWIGQSKLTLALKVAELAGILGQKNAEIARLQANLDWLMAHVNELKLERAEILEKTLGIQVPVPIIERHPVAAPAPFVPLVGADPNYAATPPAADSPLPPLRPNRGDLMQHARDLRDAHSRGEDIAGRMAAALDAGLFEDVGDDEAKRLGIEHSPGGEVVYSR
jgi:hypothetical protein